MKGQALITLIFFAVIATAITTAAIIMIAVNSLSGTNFQEGVIAYEIAQSGSENAKIRLLRNPSYTGETVSIGSGSATIQVTGTGTNADPYIIISKGNEGNFIRQYQVKATYTNNVFTVISQKEVY